MKKIKNLLIKLNLEGVGVVNYDNIDQKKVLWNTHLRVDKDSKNVSFAKKVFYEEFDGEKTKTSYKLKISDDAILKNAFRYDYVSPNPNIGHSTSLLYAYIASPISIIKGYLFPVKDSDNLKRKGSFKLGAAIQTCNAKSTMEFFSRSGEKKMNDGSDDSSDTTIFSKETVGEIKYTANGNIDLMSLQFISADSIFDRYEINPDYFKIYKEFLSKKMPNFKSELGYYQLKNSSIEIPEYGILLSNENVNFLVKETLKRLLNINITRKGAYANTSSLMIKLVNDPIIDKIDDDNNWIEIKNEKDINNLNIDFEYFYEKVDDDKSEKDRAEFVSLVKKAKEEAKNEKNKTKNKKDE